MSRLSIYYLNSRGFQWLCFWGETFFYTFIMGDYSTEEKTSYET